MFVDNMRILPICIIGCRLYPDRRFTRKFLRIYSGFVSFIK